MKTTPWLVLALALAARPAGAADLLENPSFEARGKGGGRGIPGWQARGERFGKARPVRGPDARAAVELTPVGKGSSGDDSFMLFQVLPHERLRGKRLEFGARVKADGAAVNLVLFTPEKSANDFDPATDTRGFRERRGVLEVPARASFLSFGIQVFGRPGTRAVVAEPFVRVVGEEARGGGARGGRAAPESGGAEVRIAVQAGAVERRLDPDLFCMHIEWVENGLGLLDPARGALRAPVVDKLRALRVPLFRFPGGIHADYYDWRQGVGPQGKRGKGENAFTRREEPHRFGTPELAALLRATGARALITANAGTGTPELAGSWARHLAGEGVPAPLWEVGNELYLSGPTTDGPNGRRIYRAGEKYARDFPAYRDAIRKAIPDAKVGAILHLDSGAYAFAPKENREWSERMLRALDVPADFFAVHNAYAPVIIDGGNPFKTEAGRRAAYRTLYAASEQTREDLALVARRLARAGPQRAGVPLAVTEYGPLFGVSNQKGLTNVYVDQSRTLAAAIYVASLLDVFVGEPRVMAACYTNPIHRWYGSLLTDTPEGLVVTPTYHLFSLYRERFHRGLLKTEVTAPAFDAAQLGVVKAQRGVASVTAKASRSDDGRTLGIMIVNRSVDRPFDAALALEGFAAAKADCRVLTAPSPATVNGKPLTDTTEAGAVAPRAVPCTAAPTMSLRLPPSSVTSVVLERR